MIGTYKLAHRLYDDVVSQKLLNLNDASTGEQRSTRDHRYPLQKEGCKRNIRKFYFKNCVVDQWNNLPTSIVCAIFERF